MGLGITLVVMNKRDDISQIYPAVLKLGQIGWETKLDKLRMKIKNGKYEDAKFYPIAGDFEYVKVDGYGNRLAAVPVNEMIRILKQHNKSTKSNFTETAYKILKVIIEKTVEENDFCWLSDGSVYVIPYYD